MKIIRLPNGKCNLFAKTRLMSEKKGSMTEIYFDLQRIFIFSFSTRLCGPYTVSLVEWKKVHNYKPRIPFAGYNYMIIMKKIYIPTKVHDFEL